MIEIQDEVDKALKASKVILLKRDEPAIEENYDNESFIKDEEEQNPVRIQSKKQSMVEVETRTSMKGSGVRVSTGSAGLKPKEIANKEATVSTINSDKNPPSEGIKREIQKNAHISTQSNVSQ